MNRPHLPRRRSIRLRNHDYTHPGAYFVTICTHNHALLFGRIIDNQMSLSAMGQIVQQEWMRTAELRPNVRLGAFVVMPNHVHGIIWLTDVEPSHPAPEDAAPSEPVPGGVARSAPTTASDQSAARQGRQFGRPVAGALPTVVRALKSAVTRRANEIHGTPGRPVWQKSYYEHVIRDEDDLARIRGYVETNPARWEEDRLYR